MIEGKNDLIFENEDHKRRYEEDPSQFRMYTIQFSDDMERIVGGIIRDTG